MGARWLWGFAGFAAVLGLGLATGTCEVRFTRTDPSDVVPKLNGPELEGKVADWFATDHGHQVKVACPKARLIKAEDTFTCEATTDDGTPLTITIVQKDHRGNVTMSAGFIVDTGKDLAVIKAKLPDSAVITCPRRLVQLTQPGDTASCEVRDGDDRAPLVIRLEDQDGRITMKVMPSEPPGSVTTAGPALAT